MVKTTIKEKGLLILLISTISIFCLLIWMFSKDFRMNQTWEEDSAFYIVGKNFVDFGFWKTKMLDDYAVGSDPSSHPLLYTHFPNIAGVLQGLLQTCGMKQISYIKLSFIPIFIAGMVYYFLVIRKLFTENIALMALAVTGTNYLGVLAWADNTIHSLHWVILFGALFHYLSIPPQGNIKGPYWLHLFMAWLFIFISGSLTYIHTLFLFVTIGLFYALRVYRISFRYLIILFSASLLLFILQQLRVISFLGFDIWIYDQLFNFKKALNMVDYKDLLDFYAKHGIVVWPVDSNFGSLSAIRIIKLFFDGLKSKEGIGGIFVLLGLIVAAVTHVFNTTHTQIFNVDKFGTKILTLFLASIAWNFLFTTHASNYFNATPYIMLAGMVNLGWAALFIGITSKSFFEKLSTNIKTYMFIIILCFAIFSYQRVNLFLKNPITPIPGTGILQQYKGAKFYSNIWPLFVSYYTGEWTVGGIDPADAVARQPQNARWFLQRDKMNSEKYSKPDYYFYAFSQKVAPFAEPRHKKILDEAFPIVECGENWCIYNMIKK